MHAKSPWRLDRLAGLAGLILLGAALAVALFHLRDLSRIQHIAGVWIGLAAALEQGTFYPPLEDHGFYGGTRYMPVVFALLAGLGRVGGDWLVAAKLTALLTTLALLAGLFVAAQRQAGTGQGLFFAVLLLALPEGLNALLTPHADALAAALAVWGLLCLDREQLSPGWIVLAGLLFALAFLSKFSAVAGPAAVGAWLLMRRRPGPAAGVAGLSAALAALGVLGCDWLSAGRMLDNFHSLASGGMSGESIRLGPVRLLIALCRPTPFLLVWPVAGVLLLLRARARDWGVWEWYLAWSLLVTAVIFTSPGTEFNHLVELQAACLIVLARKGGETATACVVPGVVGLVVLAWGLVLLLPGPDRSAIGAQQLREVVPAGSRLLSEDASVPVLLGQRPVVLDPFSYRILAERGRIDDEELAGRIRRQEFDVLVMLAPLEPPEQGLCPRFHFGPAVTQAMRRAYRHAGTVGRYHVYRPVGAALARRTFCPAGLMQSAPACR